MSFSSGGYLLPNGTFREYDPVSLVCAESGGQGPFTWQWSFGDGTNATVAGVTSIFGIVNHTFGKVGAFNVTCLATDSLGAIGSANTTIRTASWPLVSAAVVLSPVPSILQGYMVSIQAEAIYGYGPLSYLWSGLPPGCDPPPPNVPRMLCAPSTPGTYNVTVAVHDPVTNHTAYAYARLTVAAAFLGLPQPQAYLVVGLVLLLATLSELLRRLWVPVPPGRNEQRFLQGWILAAAGGVLGLASLALPWLYVTLPTATGTATGTFAPTQLFMNDPSSTLPPTVLGGYPFYPNSLWSVIAPQIVACLIFASGCVLAILRRMQGGSLMALGLAIALLAVPGQWFPTWGLGAGWYVGGLGALLALGGYLVWFPPTGIWPPITPVPHTAPKVRAPADEKTPPPESPAPPPPH